MRIGRRIFSNRGSPMTNMSLHVSCIAETPPELFACAAEIPERGQRNTRGISLKDTRYEGHACPYVQSLFRDTATSRRFQSGECFVSSKYWLSLGSKARRRTIKFGGGRRSHPARGARCAGRLCERRLYGTSSIFVVRHGCRSRATSRAARFRP